MELRSQPQDPPIELVETDSGEVTLLIDGHQAMQAWESELMWEMADLLCEYGSEFLEVGLGLGISALRIAGNPRTRQHIVLEKYEKVIELFKDRHTELPDSLEIVNVDLFDYVHELESESVDGIFLDPYIPRGVCGNMTDPVWEEVMPVMVRALRIGGVMIPMFAKRPELNELLSPYFRRVIVERRSFYTYPSTKYMSTTDGVTDFTAPPEGADDHMSPTKGTAYIQCFIKTVEPNIQ
ncbi:MAG: class I SAM-dependent methyltransferase [Pseudonocardiaceae bacterium]